MARIVFDFDGTLADTFPLIVDVAYRLSPRTRRLPPEALVELRRLPLITAMQRLGIAHWRLPILVLLTRRRMTAHMGDVKPYEGVIDMIKTLHKANHKLYILTSNYEANVRVFLKHHKVDRYFGDIDTVRYANTWTKTRALRKLLKRHGISASDAWHIGNEALDMRAAKRVGMRGIAVTWSGYDNKILKSTKPFKIIDHPQQLPKLLK